MITYTIKIKHEEYFSLANMNCSYENIIPKYKFIEKC